MKRVFPVRDRGAPKYQYAEYLIIKLGEIYVRATGKNPTLGGAVINLSRFERFAMPILNAFEIGNFRNRIRQYLQYRKNQGLWSSMNSPPNI